MTKTEEARLLEYLNSSKEELRSLLFALCAIPAPIGAETARAQFCRDWLKENGADGVYIDPAKNTVLPLGCDGDKPIIALLAHTDTVFPDTEPMPLRIDGEIARCPGIGDDTANLAVLLLLARYFLLYPPHGSYGLLFVCNAGEEGFGNLSGTRRIFDDYKGRIHALLSLDCTVDDLCNRAVGSARYRITFTTDGGHSFFDFGKRNAIAEAAAFITALYRTAPPLCGESVTTYNVGMISGGTSVNSIAQKAELLFEYRSDSALCMEKMQRQMQALLTDAGKDGVHIETELLGERPGMGPVDPARQSELTELCARTIREVTGCTPTCEPGSTDCNIPLSLGIPAVSFGCYRGAGMHTREEWLELSSLRPGAEAAARIILRLLSRD